MFGHSPDALERARRLRRELSLPERLLWRILRTKPSGVKFRNQHPLGDYVVDFYCHAARTVFEIDGLVHEMGDQAEFDVRRDAQLAALGARVIRIRASEVLRDPTVIAENMIQACLHYSSNPAGAAH